MAAAESRMSARRLVWNLSRIHGDRVAQNRLSTNTIAAPLDCFSTEDIDLNTKLFDKVFSEGPQLEKTYLRISIEFDQQIHVT
jgi:hypothetical protein